MNLSFRIYRFCALTGAAMACAVSVAQTNTLLGAGLDGVIDWSRTNHFVDMVKQSRGFFSISGGDVPKDANGWPTQDCALILQTTGAGEQRIYKGDYNFSFTGKATVTVELGGGTTKGVAYNARTNTTSGILSFDPGTSGNYFWVSFKNTTGGIKNLRVLRPGYALTTKQVFDTTFLNHVKRFNNLRFMDMKATNGNQATTWDQRSKPTDACYTGPYGVPWETCIDLGNAVGRDIWVNIPAHADDTYVRSLAKLIDTRLDPKLHVYVEYSNEVWNWGFERSHYNYDQAQAEVDRGGSDLQLPGETGKNPDGSWEHKYDFNYRRIAKRAKQVSDIFKRVFGEATFGDRLRPIFASQIGWPAVGVVGLDWVNTVYGSPSKFFYGYAGAPYFNLGDADTKTDLTKDQVLKALSDTVNSYTDVHGGGSMIAQYAATATYYGLKLLAYEGGPDTFGPNNIAAKRDASLDPKMRELCVRYLNNWYKFGGGLFNWFVAGATDYNTQYGTWGLTNDMTNLQAPKSLAMDDVLGAPLPALTIGTPTPGATDAREYVGSGPDWSTRDPYLRWLNTGSAFDYLVRTPTAGIGKFRAKLGSTQNGAKLRVIVNNTLAGLVTAPNTGGDENFQWSPTINVPLNAGLNTVRIVVVTNLGYNISAVQVAGPNDTFPPEITPLANQLAPVGAPTAPQSFTISDPDTDIAKLTVSAVSDNLTLVPNANIRFTGKNATRSVTVKPASASAGSANIQITVSDGTSVASRTFKVTFGVAVSGGVLGDYFAGTELAGAPLLSRLDPTVNFDWSTTGPNSTVGQTNFSVRWNGFLKPEKAEAVTFYTQSDDGIRLWVNGTLVIDNWTFHGTQENTSQPITLPAGKLATVRLEYFQGYGGAVAKLLWSTPTIAKAVIPASALFSVR
jgi:PA14 domain